MVLAYSEYFEDIQTAFAREKQVQNWSRAKREALISGDVTLLKIKAKKEFKK